MIARIGLVLGLLVFFAIGFASPPAGLSAAGQWAAATGALMSVWWLSEALPPAVTALVPIVALPMTGAMAADDVTRSYASETNLLFLGGLMIAMAVEHWGLHRRMALWIIEKFGRTPSGLVFGFMAATGAISAWISNAATTMMMLPIATAVLAHFREEHPKLERELAPPLLLSIAHASTIGGLATIVGTPPNAVFVGQMAKLFPDAPPIGFLQWMLVGVPVTLLLLPVTWFYLVRFASPLWQRTFLLDHSAVADQRQVLGPMTTPERRVMMVFAAAALLWMLRAPIHTESFTFPGWSGLLSVPRAVGDSTVAIAMALVLFVIPSGRKPGERLLDWPTAAKLPWGVLVLLGGGFALADATRATGLAEWIGSNLGSIGGVSAFVKVATLCLVITFLTEVMTNTALVTIMMPVLAASAVASGTDPLLLMLPCTLSASLGFMMPSGTAPNAIVFSTGHLTVAYMARVGFALNLLSVVVVTAATFLLARPVFGISLVALPPWAHP
ncbi:MAG TPA: SLC13 family permease [Candidatus Limnocylindrales bacterium]|nr:SLC13 family permease [Candidatus Limnocylindrales bacterium]